MSDNRQNVKMPIFNVSEEFGDIYTMNTHVKGKVYIIVNEKGIDKDIFSDRPGSQRDVDALRDTLQKLKFEVIVEYNLTASQILKLCREASAVDHSPYCAFVLCILSHGGKHVVYGVDGVPVYLRDLTDCFMASNCKTLSGKPKIFLIQACQGNKEQILQQKLGTRQKTGIRDVIVVPAKTMFSDNKEDDDVDPDQSDFLIAYSTTPGYVSYRDAIFGSFFIQTLCRHINESCANDHLLDILTDVNNDLSQQKIEVENNAQAITMPMQKSTLRKKIYLKPNVVTMVHGWFPLKVMSIMSGVNLRWLPAQNRFACDHTNIDPRPRSFGIQCDLLPAQVLPKLKRAKATLEQETSDIYLYDEQIPDNADDPPYEPSSSDSSGSSSSETAHDVDHLLDILTGVNNDLGQQNIEVEDGAKAKTEPIQKSTLRKKILFGPEEMRRPEQK